MKRLKDLAVEFGKSVEALEQMDDDEIERLIVVSDAWESWLLYTIAKR